MDSHAQAKWKQAYKIFNYEMAKTCKVQLNHGKEFINLLNKDNDLLEYTLSCTWPLTKPHAEWSSLTPLIDLDWKKGLYLHLFRTQHLMFDHNRQETSTEQLHICSISFPDVISALLLHRQLFSPKLQLIKLTLHIASCCCNLILHRQELSSKL